MNSTVCLKNSKMVVLEKFIFKKVNIGKKVLTIIIIMLMIRLLNGPGGSCDYYLHFI